MRSDPRLYDRLFVEGTGIRSVVVLGAGGFVGGHLLAALETQQEIEIRVLAHERPVIASGAAARVKVVTGDLRDIRSLGSLFVPGCVVYNLAFLRGSPYEEHMAAARNVVEMCRREGVSRLVHCSTAMVFGDLDVGVVGEAAECRPRSEYERVKWGIEQVLRDGLDGVCELAILRPTAVFGPQGRNLVKMASELQGGVRLSNYAKCSVFYHRRMNLVSVQNVVGALLFVGEPGRRLLRTTYIVSDDATPANSYGAVASRLMERLVLKPYLLPVIPLPVAISRAVLRLVRSPRTNPRQVFSQGGLEAEGYRSVVSFETALDGFADWFRETHPR